MPVFDKKGVFGEDGQTSVSQQQGSEEKPAEQVQEQAATTPTVQETSLDSIRSMISKCKPIAEIMKGIPIGDELKSLLETISEDEINEKIYKVSTAINDTKKLVQLVEMESEVFESELSLNIRFNPISYGFADGKITENSIKATINNNINAIKLRKNVINYNYVHNGLFNVLKILQAKASQFTR